MSEVLAAATVEQRVEGRVAITEEIRPELSAGKPLGQLLSQMVIKEGE